MTTSRNGISGLAVALATAGGFLVVAGIKDIPILDGLRQIIQGRVPTGSPPRRLLTSLGDAVTGSPGTVAGDLGAAVGGTGAGAGDLGARIAADAQRYLGTRYQFGGHDPTGFDCSGLVTYVLHHDLGLSLPNNIHTVAHLFLTWSGARTIPRSQQQAGDLVCWAGHIGIAVDNKRMINAPTVGDVVKISNVWSVPPPVIRRVIG